jgi:hypothetical protein
MNRTLLNTFSTFELGLIVVGGVVLLAVLGFILVHRYVSPETRIENNEVAGILLGLLGAFYGIVLGFAIVVLFEDFRSADASVKDETTALAQVYRDAGVFSPPDQARIGRAIARYSLAVREDEWPLMRDGAESQKAHDLLGTIYDAVEAAHLNGTKQETLFGAATGALGDVVAARRTRLSNASQTLPPVFQVFLLGGTAVLLVFLWFFGMRNMRAHLLLVAGVAATMAFSLLLALELAYPFSGDIAVSSNPFRLGIIGELSPETGLPTGQPCFQCTKR